MKKLLILAGWIVGALVLLNMGVDSLYGGTVSTRGRTPVPPGWSNVVPPVTNPNPRTNYRP